MTDRDATGFLHESVPFSRERGLEVSVSCGMTSPCSRELSRRPCPIAASEAGRPLPPWAHAP